VIAFGDAPNDLPVLRWAGVAVAVAGAHPDVLACADVVTAGNDEDGVALMLEELFGPRGMSHPADTVHSSRTDRRWSPSMYRQGDVLVVPVPPQALPTDLMPAPRDRRNRMVLALGEATGHAHVVTGEGVALLCPQDDPGQLYLTIEGYGRLVHDEHGPIALGPGNYRVVRQREYTPGAIRPVAD
jgi:hypothetical protein